MPVFPLFKALPVVAVVASGIAAMMIAIISWQSATAGSATYVVDTALDSNLTACQDAVAGDCSLRGALNNANAASSAGDVITFDQTIFSPASPISINLASSLPAMTGGGDTVDGFGAGVILDTASEPSAFACLTINSDDNAIKGIQFTDCLTGIQVSVGASLNAIGPNNTIYDNTTGILVNGDTTSIVGNRIGTTVDGSAVNPAGGNTGDGISVVGINNVIGGSAIQDRNVISGNGANGVDIEALGTGNAVRGNYIGTSANGTTDLGNNQDGVVVRANDAIIGGASTGEGNLISGNNSDGVESAAGAATGVHIVGNLIGTDSAGTSDLGNSTNGVNLVAGAVIVGGTSSDDRNVISGNNGAGVRLASASSVIQGNFIGTDVTGTLDIGNSAEGINVAASGATGVIIGGTEAGSGNLISGNNSNGITLFAGSSSIQGNLIGTDVTGAMDLGNSLIGITVNTANNTVGGLAADARNVVSGNNSAGINISGAGATSNDVQFNYVGVQADGASPLGNGSHGIIIANGASGNTLGGDPAAPNVIAFNSGDGVAVISGSSIGNTITDNSIHSNVGLGIDLNPDGVTENDAVPDGDIGANNLQNFPTLTGVSSIGGITSILGSATGPANTSVTLNFYHSASCDPSGNGEGEVQFAASSKVTSGGGSVAINDSFAIVLPAGRFITATTTSAGGHTSEFSDCIEVPPLIVNDASHPGDGTCTVANCTLSEAISAANTAVGPDIIEFAIGSGPQVVSISGTGLPTSLGPITIDGTSQPGFSSAPIVELDGSGASGGTPGLSLAGSGNIIKGMVISGFTGNGITLNVGSQSTIQGNYIGLDTNGVTDAGNSQDGIFVNGSANNLIGGSAPSERNVISGNNGNGVRLTGAAATGNVVSGNIIGLDVAGGVDVGNSLDGVHISTGATLNRIGVDAPGARNVISGNNFDGVEVASGSSANTIENNLIGTDGSGILDLGNTFEGVLINSSPSNQIGGTGTYSTNVISGNNSDGIEITGASSTGTVVQGNLIGTDTNGSLDVGNSSGGVNITNSPTNVSVGGAEVGSGNLISGNNSFGVGVSSANASARVLGNLIGTDAGGNAAIGNGAFGGVRIAAAGNNVIGGTTSAERNLISGNLADGVRLESGAFSNFISGNYIGTRADGSTALGNAGNGVNILAGDGNDVGGGAGATNTIAFNTLRGIQVSSGVANTVAANSIHSNGALGIDLGPLGVTANDLDDPDFGPNRQQNFPVVTLASTGGVDLTVAGTLNSVPSTTFTIRIFSGPSCDSSSFGEGEQYVTSFKSSTDASGDASFTEFFPILIPAGYFLTTTATNDSTADTSEFSQCVQVVSDLDGDEDAVSDLVESGCGSNIHQAASTPERVDSVFSGTDEDKDVLFDEPLPPGAAPFDCDGDGYIGEVESGSALCTNAVNDDNTDDAVVNDGCGAVPQAGAFSESAFKIGTSDQDACGFNGWPSELVTTGLSANKLTIQDVIAFLNPTRHLDTSPGQSNYDSRFDIVLGRGAFTQWINIQDTIALFSGPTAFPRMFNGTRAFDKVCPWPP